MVFVKNIIQRTSLFLLRIFRNWGWVGSLERATVATELIELLSAIQLSTFKVELARVGGDNDGGYLVPVAQMPFNRCFSPGVGLSVEFEKALAKDGTFCHLLDASVDDPGLSRESFEFQNKFLGVASNVKELSMEDWIKPYVRDDEKIILQMDIDGAEYEILASTERSILRIFSVIIIEFHNLHRLMDSSHFPLISSVFKKMLREFNIVHMHVNNCAKSHRFKQMQIWPVVEFTFLKKEYCTDSEEGLKIPHPLDQPNILGRKNFVISKEWYR